MCVYQVNGTFTSYIHSIEQCDTKVRGVSRVTIWQGAELVVRVGKADFTEVGDVGFGQSLLRNVCSVVISVMSTSNIFHFRNTIYRSIED
jgi:hypothetical protein